MLRSSWIQSIVGQRGCLKLPVSADITVQRQYTIDFDRLDDAVEFLDGFDLPDSLTADFYTDDSFV